MDLIPLYESLLKFAGLEPTGDGYVSVAFTKDRRPATSEGASIVLPTREHLRTPSPAKLIFHPLAENLLQGPSKTLEFMRSAINVKLNHTFCIIGQELLSLAASPALHGGLDPDQSQLLISLGDVDEKSRVNFTTMSTILFTGGVEKAFINIYLKRGGSVKGRKYARAGVVTFPGYELLNDPDNKTFKDLKLRAKDIIIYKALYKYIFPNIDEAEHYNAGTDSFIAPYFDALMKTSLRLATCCNDVLFMFEKYIDQSDKLMFDADWVPVFDNLEAIDLDIKRIPPQGIVAEIMAKDTPVPPPVATLPMAPPAYAPPPLVAPPAYAPPPVYQPAPAGYYQQPPVAAGPSLQYTENGLDIHSIPGFNNIPNPLANQMYSGYGQPLQQQGPRPPSWTQNNRPGMFQGQGMYQQPGWQQSNQGFCNNGSNV